MEITCTIGLTRWTPDIPYGARFDRKTMKQNTFTITFDAEPKPHGVPILDYLNDVCERIFGASNTYGEIHNHIWLAYAAAMPKDRDHTSLSVRDTITFDSISIECCSIGWATVQD